MRNLTTTVFLSSLLFTVPAFAGPGHDHSHGPGHSHAHSQAPISGKVAANKARQKLNQLIDKKRIHPSWSAAKVMSVEQKTYGHGPEWVVTFKNRRLGDASKQTLYIFFSLNGHYIAANYTGK